MHNNSDLRMRSRRAFSPRNRITLNVYSMISKIWEKRKAERKKSDEAAIQAWREGPFRDVSFPIVILKGKDYLAVSDLEEYYFDVDINTWFVNEKSELVDSSGKKFTFKKVNDEQWIPDEAVGLLSFDALKERIVPAIYMPSHLERIDNVSDVKSIIELILTY